MNKADVDASADVEVLTTLQSRARAKRFWRMCWNAAEAGSEDSWSAGGLEHITRR